MTTILSIKRFSSGRRLLCLLSLTALGCGADPAVDPRERDEDVDTDSSESSEDEDADELDDEVDSESDPDESSSGMTTRDAGRARPSLDAGTDAGLRPQDAATVSDGSADAREVDARGADASRDASSGGTDPGFPDKDYYNPVTPCEKGAISGDEIVIMGDSFFALSGAIKRNLESHAAQAGAPNPYRSYAVSGSTLSGNGISGQYDRALRQGPVKFVIMDGGGNDSLLGSCTECPGIVEQLFGHMAENGTTDVLYTFYPDPGNPIGSAPFKPSLDALRLEIRELCVKESGLRCHFLDLRPYWEAGDTSDGLHPTASGAQHVADAIWDFMQKDCLGQ